MTQAARSANALWTRLSSVWYDGIRRDIMAAPNHPGGNFLRGMTDVKSIVPHETTGWPSRNRVEQWVANNYKSVAGKQGVGPQAFIAGDGTVIPLVDFPLMTGHATFVNSWSLGIETGHSYDERGGIDIAPNLAVNSAARRGWHELSHDTDEPEDIPGARLFVADQISADPPEVIASWWTTANYTTPARERPGETIMIFSEAQYRSWALLARYLAEAFLVPRNFPVMPHAMAEREIDNPATFRKIVFADENFVPIVRELRRAGLVLAEQDFDGAHAEDLTDHYRAARRERSTLTARDFGFDASSSDTHRLNVRLNEAWLRLFTIYRGLHGHGFAGTPMQAYPEHDCPGQMFDWHRFAREIWDWWWYPFDFEAARTSTAVRGYRTADGATPLVEYFYEAPQQPSYAARAAAPGGIHGPGSSPHTFRLESGSRVYALANGELVAASFPATGDAVSLAFTLVRHEVYHLQVARGLDPALLRIPGAGSPIPTDTRIDYNPEPSYVYSLYMHLGRADGMDFDRIVPGNPDWLNRLLIRKKECDLGLKFYNSSNHGGMDIAHWAPPPGGTNRPSLVEGWNTDGPQLAMFLNTLKAGDVAIAPYQSRSMTVGPTPIRVILGDLLGNAGVIRKAAGVSTTGVRVEVFSSSIIDPYFTEVTGQPSWVVAPGVAHPVIRYRSEWAGTPDAARTTALQAVGVNTSLLEAWWDQVTLAQSLDVRLPAAARLNIFGSACHYDPLDFMQWINRITWASEWPKYRVKGADGLVARPDSPRPRRFA
jgi:N-acetylmuramoyl-L-alanine amidase